MADEEQTSIQKAETALEAANEVLRGHFGEETGHFDNSQAVALIGIGHALLALTREVAGAKIALQRLK